MANDNAREFAWTASGMTIIDREQSECASLKTIAWRSANDGEVVDGI